MAKDPAFLFYSSDFLTGTFIMSFEDRGKYITLLSIIHQQGRLTLDQMKNVCGGQVSQEIIGKFKQDENGKFFNERLESEMTKRKNFTESRRRNLKSHTDNHTGPRMENENENENGDINAKRKRKVKKEFSPPTVEDMIQFFKEKNFPESLARKVFAYYNTTNDKGINWHDSRGKPILNWKQKCIAVWMKEENRNYGTVPHNSKNQHSIAAKDATNFDLATSVAKRHGVTLDVSQNGS